MRVLAAFAFAVQIAFSAAVVSTVDDQQTQITKWTDVARQLSQ
jgi:hypothetical protein